MTSADPVISQQTRQRLLDVAADVFAEKGYAASTVREICRQAHANIAAVNYHFGDKQKLYAAAFQHLQTPWFDPKKLSDMPPEAALREYIRQFMKHIFDPGHSSCPGRILAHEMSQPTEMLEQFVESDVRPRINFLQEIIRQIGGDLPPRAIAKCVLAVIGQMLHYYHARAVIKRISPIYADLDQHVEELVDQITRFSMGGIRAIADRYQKSVSR